MASSLPSPSETAQVFKDFKQVLRLSRFLTPLQRVNHLHSDLSSIALEQKKTAQTDSVFNLLKPGHETCLKVDLLRVIADMGENCYVKIPVTLVISGKEGVLMRNNKSGQVVCRTFQGVKTAVGCFVKETESVSVWKALFPRYVHKIRDRPLSLLTCNEQILPLLREAAEGPQYVQQFIQPQTKTVSLIRVHWKACQPVATFYFLSKGHTRSNSKQQSLATQITGFGLNRSYSEAMLPLNDVCINRASLNLVIRKTHMIPELDRSLHEIVRILNFTIGKRRKVSEMVCDFVCESPRQYVFLACKGFSFTHKGESIVRTVQQEQGIDIRFLMYPVVAQRHMIHQKLTTKIRTSLLLQQRRGAVLSADSPSQPSASPPSAPVSLTDLKPTTPSLTIEGEIMTRDVGKLETLLQGSRMHKQVLKRRVDVVQKYGGAAKWTQPLKSLCRNFFSAPEIQVYFDEQVNFEETSLITHSVTRVLKGDCNFYYKELLRSLHSRLHIPKAHYQVFLSELQDKLQEVGLQKEDEDTVMDRFRDLETYICG